jgi:hypothetical protein
MRVAVNWLEGTNYRHLGSVHPPQKPRKSYPGVRKASTPAPRVRGSKRLQITEFLPDYKAHGRAAPLRRNDQIIEYSDLVLAFWGW